MPTFDLYGNIISFSGGGVKMPTTAPPTIPTTPKPPPVFNAGSTTPIPLLPPNSAPNEIDDALEAQTKAVETAKEYQGELFGELKEMYQPLINLGQEQLQVLQQGIGSGAFSMDDSIFQGYQPYIAPLYQPPPQFNYEPYRGPGVPQPQPFNYQGGQIRPFEYGQQPQQFDYKGPDIQQFQGGQQSIQPFKYQGQQPGQFNYQGPQAGQFNPTSDFGQRPDFYQSPDAQPANYYDPTREQYQGKEFNIEDDPVYQRRLERSGEAIEASAAARGMQLSGSTLQALQENAQGIAAEEGQAAWDRWRAEDQTGYSRFQDQQNRVQSAMNYQNEDQYRRYLDSVGIRGAEADRAIGQWNADRSFIQQAGVENFLTGLQGQGQGFGQQLAGYEANLAGQGQGYGQQLAGYEANLAAQGQGFGQNLAGYQTNLGAQGQGFGQALAGYEAGLGAQGQGFGQSLAGYQTNLAQQNLNRDFLAQQQQQNYLNQMGAYGAGIGQYNLNRAFDYGASRDYAGDQWNQYLQSVGQGNLQGANQYGMMTDAYNRQLVQRLGQYGMIGDLSNVGIGALGDISKAMTGYYGSISDFALQSANAQAAAAMARQQNQGLLGLGGIFGL